jgi:CRP/FNR family transcriptional regulator, cyclic AMP receptor protein
LCICYKIAEMSATIPNQITINDARLPFIRKYNLFTHLYNDEFIKSDFLHSVIEAKKGDYIYFEPQFLSKLFFIKEGFIKIGYINNSGNEIVKEILQKGEMFGQFTLEQSNMNGEFAQVHKSTAVICAFTIENFQDILNGNSQLAIAYSKQMGNKLRRVENRLLNMLNSDVKTRLLRFFKELIHSNTDCTFNNCFKIDNFLTHDDIARLIGSSRQTVTVAINELEAMGFFKINRKQIEIKDILAIEKAAII